MFFMKNKKIGKSYSKILLKGTKVTKICSFFHFSAKNSFYQTPQYGCLWTHLNPSNQWFRLITDWVILGDSDPGAQIWVQGPFGAKLKNLHFSHKTQQYGCLWTRLDRCTLSCFLEHTGTHWHVELVHSFTFNNP